MTVAVGLTTAITCADPACSRSTRTLWAMAARSMTASPLTAGARVGVGEFDGEVCMVMSPPTILPEAPSGRSRVRQCAKCAWVKCLGLQRVEVVQHRVQVLPQRTGQVGGQALRTTTRSTETSLAPSGMV